MSASRAHTQQYGRSLVHSVCMCVMFTSSPSTAIYIILLFTVDGGGGHCSVPCCEALYFCSVCVRVCACRRCVSALNGMWVNVVCRMCRTTPRFRMAIHTRKIEEEKRFTALRRFDYSRSQKEHIRDPIRCRQNTHLSLLVPRACVFDVVAEIVLCYGLRN